MRSDWRGELGSIFRKGGQKVRMIWAIMMILWFSGSTPSVVVDLMMGPKGRKLQKIRMFHWVGAEERTEENLPAHSSLFSVTIHTYYLLYHTHIDTDIPTQTTIPLPSITARLK